MADAVTRSTAARIAALTRWDKTGDRRGATQAARDGLIARYRREVLKENPGLTDQAEIAGRVERKLRLHYERMRLSSLRTRRARAAERAGQASAALAAAIVSAGEGAAS